ncbi:MAG: pre-peptidase C-terminal domain-containing protein [Chloroflexota bacterium]
MSISQRARLAVLLGLVACLPVSAVAAHAPSVDRGNPTTAATALVLTDPTLSRAIGATISAPGEVDWYRMDLKAGDPILVDMTAPDATGTLAATFTLLGPGLPDAAGVSDWAASLASEAGVTGAVAFTPDPDPVRQVHGGLGFIQYGSISLSAPADGSYYVAVQAVDPMATGKYVLAPGVREEFGPDVVGGMADLVAFFTAAWPAASAAPSASAAPAG